MKYFSDRERGNNGNIMFTISINVWNGIATIVNALIGKNLLAKDFPQKCPDGNGICGVDEHSFYISAIAIIPRANLFLPNYGEIQYLSNNSMVDPFVIETEIQEKNLNFTYDVLDFVEFVYKHIHDIQNGEYHEYFHHYELLFPTTANGKRQFVMDVNEIFERNCIGFKLGDDGTVQRIVNELILQPINTQDKETRVAELLDEALHKFRNPKIEERRIALEKLWDSFERIKTINDPNNKKQSSDNLLSVVSQGQESFKELLNTECKVLTEIGNSFQIRHFEMNKQEIKSEQHLDYLFYRLYSLISLLIKAVQ